MKNKITQRGGARKGAGRPRLAAALRPVPVTVRVQRHVRERFADGATTAGKSQAAFFADMVEKI